MPSTDVSDALTREHHVVDTAIADFVAHLERDKRHARPLLEAIRLLRRHIYIEEVFLFPPIQRAGILMPVLVMLREHGELWRTMEDLSDRVNDPGNHEQLIATCRRLQSQLEQHNEKEEPIVYPQAATDLTAAERADLMAFLHAGHTPDGWVCQQAGGR